MKAIVTKYLPATDHKPSRVKAKAEGVPAVTVTYANHEHPHQEAALTLCRKYGWGENLISGGMPDQTGECFVFADDMVNELTEIDVEIGKHMAAIEAGEYSFECITAILVDLQNAARVALARVSVYKAACSALTHSE